MCIDHAVPIAAFDRRVRDFSAPLELWVSMAPVTILCFGWQLTRAFIERPLFKQRPVFASVNKLDEGAISLPSSQCNYDCNEALAEMSCSFLDSR